MLRQTRLRPGGAQTWAEKCVAASPSGARLAYISTLTVYVYDAATLQLTNVIAVDDKTLSWLEWSPHSEEVLATSGQDGRLRLWMVRREEPVATMCGSATIEGFAWSPHSPREILFHHGDALYLWDTVETAKPPKPLVAVPRKALRSGAVCSVAYSPKMVGVVAVGLQSGNVAILDVAERRFRPEYLRHGEENARVSAVVGLQWDPLSQAYLLAAHKDGSMALWDADGGQLLRSFEKLGGGQGAIAWMPWAPGNFAQANGRTGAIRVWNVSQSTPIDTIRLGQAGVQSMITVPAAQRCVATFVDGSMVVYHMSKRQCEFSSGAAHTETVFACEFHPGDCTLLATGSYDSSIRLWNTATLRTVATMTPPSHTGVIYSVSWNPEGTRMVTGDFNGRVVIWDAVKHRLEATYPFHRRAVYGVAWRPGVPGRTPAQVASASADESVRVLDADTGAVLRVYTREKPAYGVAWCPHTPGFLATTWGDGAILLFDTTRAANMPLRTMLGHDARTFRAAWHPLVPGVLATTSDDGTVRVWRNVPRPDADDTRWDEQDHMTVLRGHTDYTRPVVWHPELPWLLLSGSWDRTVRAWDVRTGECLGVGRGHLADVYGIALHPERPFTLATTSRDNTLRLWALGGAAAQLSARIVAAFLPLFRSCHGLGAADTKADASRPSSAGYQALLSADARSATEAGAPAQLCGAASRRVLNEVAELLGPGRSRRRSAVAVAAEAAALLASFLATDGLMTEPFQVLRAAAGDVGTTTGPSSVHHACEALAAVRGRAAALEARRRPRLGEGVLRKDDALRAAAALRAQSGDLEACCELLVEVGDWDRALALAPGVSLRFWERLSHRRAVELEDALRDDCVLHFLALRDFPAARHFYAARNQHDEALVVAHAQREMPAREGAAPAERRAVDDAEAAAAEALAHATADFAAVHARGGRNFTTAAALLALEPLEDTAEVAVQALQEVDEGPTALLLAAAVGPELVGAARVEAMLRSLADSLAFRFGDGFGAGFAEDCGLRDHAALLAARNGKPRGGDAAGAKDTGATSGLDALLAAGEWDAVCAEGQDQLQQHLRGTTVTNFCEAASAGEAETLCRSTSLLAQMGQRGGTRCPGFGGLVKRFGIHWTAGGGDAKAEGKDEDLDGMGAAWKGAACARKLDYCRMDLVVDAAQRRAALCLLFYVGLWRAMAQGYSRIVSALFHGLLEVATGRSRAAPGSSETKSEPGDPDAKATGEDGPFGGPKIPVSLERVIVEVASYLAVVGDVAEAATIIEIRNATKRLDAGGPFGNPTAEEVALLAAVVDTIKAMKCKQPPAAALLPRRNLVLLGDTLHGGRAQQRRRSYVDGGLLMSSTSVNIHGTLEGNGHLSLGDAQMWVACCPFTPTGDGQNLRYPRD